MEEAMKVTGKEIEEIVGNIDQQIKTFTYFVNEMKA